MSNDSNKELAAPESSKDSHSGKGAAKTGLVWVALLASLAALLVAAGTAYLFFAGKIGAGAGEQAATLARLQTQLDSVTGSIKRMDERHAEVAERIAGLNRQQDDLHKSIAALYNRQADSLNWAVAEIEHLIVIALHSLTLERNSVTALAALQAADARLRNLDDPALHATRKQLAADLAALQAVNTVDITGLSLFLADLAGRAGQLPLKQAVKAAAKTTADAPQPASTWHRLWRAVWQELRGLVVITRSDATDKAVLLPEESYFLSQNLRLQLEAARVAAMRQDTQNFQASIATVKQWLKEYFDMTDSGVMNIEQSLGQMAALELAPALPDISSTLETLHAYMKNGADSVPPGAGEPEP